MNGRLIAERRLALGISRADLARLTGLSWTLLTTLEEKREPPFVTLNAARRLARALAVDLNGIADSWHAPVAASDDVRLERLLASADGAHTYAELAFAMEWPLQRVIAAADGLEHRLLDSGQALKTSPRGVRLASRGGRYTTCDLARLRSPPANLAKRQAEAELLRIAIIGTSEQRCCETSTRCSALIPQSSARSGCSNRLLPMTRPPPDLESNSPAATRPLTPREGRPPMTSRQTGRS